MVRDSGRRKSVDDPQQFETSPFPPDQCSRHINPLREILDVTQYLVVDFGEPENYLVGDIARCIATHVPRASRIERDEAQRLMNLHYQRGDQNSPHALRVSKTGGVSTGSAPSRLRLALSQLITRLKTPDAEGEKHHYPKLRNFVLDVLSEGRQKNIIQVLFEADIGGVKDRLAEHRLRTGESVTITSYVAKCFVAAIAADKRMQAYRLGRSQLIVFDDVDLAFLVEREWEGKVLPVFFIVRAADRKTAHEINQELQASRETPLGTQGAMSALEMVFFLLPAVLRKPLWWYVRRNPYWFKDMAGTVAVTSMGMFTSGGAVVIPITPMTMTLSIGSIEKKLVLQDGQVVERDFIHLNINVDHAIIDGAPLMRFVHRFKEILLKGPWLAPSAEGIPR